MLKNSLYILFIGLFFIQCSKKTADAVQDMPKEDTMSEDLSWRSSAPAAAPARPIELGEYSAFDMENGLKVIVVENHKLPRVSYQLSLLNDPILEGDQVGYVSFAGDLLATGTESKSKADIDASVDFIGASLNTSSRGVYASSLKKHSDKLLSLMTDVLYNPSFPESEFEKLKTQTLSGLASAKTDPNAIASNVSSVVNYGKDHPYGEVQTEEHVGNITLDKCKEYYNMYFKPNNAYLIIVGDINPEEAKMTAEKYFGDWKSGDIPQPKYDAPTIPTSTQVAFANKDGAVQSVIRVTYPVNLQPGDDDAIKASLMNNILGGGIFSGRLMQNLREDKAYTYGARSSLSSDELIGNFNAYASVRNEVTDSSVTEFLYEMERMVNEPVSADDLQLVKNSMTGSFARSLESPQTIARFARNIYKYDLPKDYYQTYLQKLNAVTIEDVTAMAKKYIRPDKANIVVVGSKDDVSDRLKKFDSDQEIDMYDAFGNKLEKNNMTVPADLTAEGVINNYLSAMGGKDKLMAIKSLKTEMNMEVMGQQASMEQGQADGKYYMEMSMMGNVMQEQRFDGTKMKVGQMGQNQIVTDEAQIASMKEQAEIVSQISYLNSEDYKLALKGIEDVNGKKAYKVEVTKPNGDKVYEYYNMVTNLMMQQVISQEGPGGQSMTITTEVSDYKEVDGVMMPYTITVNGAMPQPLVMKVQSYEVNGTIPAEKFATE